jgi:hypothetical protein
MILIFSVKFCVGEKYNTPLFNWRKNYEELSRCVGMIINMNTIYVVSGNGKMEPIETVIVQLI